MVNRDRLTEEQRAGIVRASGWLILMWLVATPLWVLGFWLADVSAAIYVIVGVISVVGVGWAALLVLLFRR
jgi:uncharacterized membrane protein